MFSVPLRVCSAWACATLYFMYMAGITLVKEIDRRVVTMWLNPVSVAEATWEAGVSEKVSLFLVWQAKYPDSI